MSEPFREPSSAGGGRGAREQAGLVSLAEGEGAAEVSPEELAAIMVAHRLSARVTVVLGRVHLPRLREVATIGAGSAPSRPGISGPGRNTLTLTGLHRQTRKGGFLVA